MGNAYVITPMKDRKGGWNCFREATPGLLVHGARNWTIAERMLLEGKSMSEIYRSFCGYCGEYIEDGDCGCGNTQPQEWID